MSASLDFDWNLLKSLEALLQERNVTRAAARVGLSQPAMSRSLARLREVFQDEILVRSGRNMEPTVRAEKLLGMLGQMRAQVSEAVEERSFEASTTVRSFTLCGADFSEIALMPPLMRILSQEAPGLTVRFVHSSSNPDELLADRSVDLMLVPRLSSASVGIVGHRLFDEEFACIVRKDHPEVDKRLSLQKFCALNHLLIAPRGRPGGVVDSELVRRGLSRHIAISVPSFLSAPQIIASTDLIATLPARLARLFARVLPLKVLTPPLKLPGFSLMQYWSGTKTEDPAHQYVRGAMMRAAKTVGSELIAPLS